ncbi:MAG: hypothetical protein WCR52_17335, partial [Bacteroidota bacterium]
RDYILNHVILNHVISNPQCPAGKTIVIPAGVTQMAVSYNTPTGSTDRPCGGTYIQRTLHCAERTRLRIPSQAAKSF